MTDNFQEQIGSLRQELSDLRELLELAEVLTYKPRKLGEPITDGKWISVAGAGFFHVSFIYRCECGHLHRGTVEVRAHTADGSVHSVKGPCSQVTAVQIYKGVVPSRSEVEAPREQTPEERLKSYSSKQ
jgi:hypothetical protein